MTNSEESPPTPSSSPIPSPSPGAGRKLLRVLLPLVALAAFPVLMWSWRLGKLQPIIQAVRGDCRHTLKSKECPLCTPAVAKSMGWCAGHDIPEAWCTKCQPKLIPAWQAEGDFCAGHGIPESVCLACDSSRSAHIAELRSRYGGGSGPTGKPGNGPAPSEVCKHTMHWASRKAVGQSTLVVVLV